MSTDDILTLDFKEVVGMFLTCADDIVSEGLLHARQDDPHRFERIPDQFDDRRALKRLVVDYLGPDVHVSLLLVGTSGGEPKVIKAFTARLHGVQPAKDSH